MYSFFSDLQYDNTYIHTTIHTAASQNWLTLLGLGGGNMYFPLTFERLSSKNYLSQ